MSVRRPPSTASSRDHVDLIVMRAAFLDPDERLLIEQIFARDMLPRDVGKLTGVSARTVQRHVRAIVDRLTSADTQCILRRRRRWAPITAQIATAVYLRGHPLRRVAADCDLTLHEVRRHIERIRGLIHQPESES